jgi:hypothetical protein
MFGGSLAGNVSSSSLSSSRSCSRFVFSWRVSFGTACPPFRQADQIIRAAFIARQPIPSRPSGRHMTLSDLVAAIDSERRHGNLSSAKRNAQGNFELVLAGLGRKDSQRVHEIDAAIEAIFTKCLSCLRLLGVVGECEPSFGHFDEKGLMLRSASRLRQPNALGSVVP